jgi:hypothetical protein
MGLHLGLGFGVWGLGVLDLLLCFRFWVWVLDLGFSFGFWGLGCFFGFGV